MSRSSSPIRLLALSGSLRRDSTNTVLLHTAAELAAEGVEVVIHPLGGLPMFDEDLEVDAGFPETVEQLRAAVREADGLLLAAPEYNGSVSPPMKNAIDWLSRAPEPPTERIPTVLVSAAASPGGGSGSQEHLRVSLAKGDVDVLDDALRIGGVDGHVVDGRLVTQEHRDHLASLVAALAARVEERRRRAEVA